MTHREQADLFVKLLPFVMNKKGEATIDVRVDLKDLITRYASIREKCK